MTVKCVQISQYEVYCREQRLRKVGTERTQYSGLKWSNYRKEKLAVFSTKCKRENINVKPGEILLSEDYVSFQARNQLLYMLKLMSNISGLE